MDKIKKYLAQINGQFWIKFYFSRRRYTKQHFSRKNKVQNYFNEQIKCDCESRRKYQEYHKK